MADFVSGTRCVSCCLVEIGCVLRISTTFLIDTAKRTKGLSEKVAYGWHSRCKMARNCCRVSAIYQQAASGFANYVLAWRLLDAPAKK